MLSRLKVLLAGAVMAVAVLATAGMALAQDADTPLTINPTPDNTSFTNGIVYSTIRSGDHIYVGGKFTRVRNPDGTSFAATNLARFERR